jgi:hypothetical protein
VTAAAAKESAAGAALVRVERAHRRRGVEVLAGVDVDLDVPLEDGRGPFVRSRRAFFL